MIQNLEMFKIHRWLLCLLLCFSWQLFKNNFISIPRHVWAIYSMIQIGLLLLMFGSEE